MESYPDIDKIDLIIAVCHKCADILKDPTTDKALDGAPMTAEERNKARECAYDDLILSIETLGDVARYNQNYYDVLDIANKLKISINDISSK